MLCFWLYAGLKSQTIVNTEKLTSKTAKGINVGLDVNFDFEAGNSDVIEVEGNSIFGYENDQQSINLLTGIKYLSEDENELIYRNFIHLRHNYFITKDFRSFSFYQLQRNSSLLLKRRQLMGGGLRKKFTVLDSIDIDIGSGLMYEMETLNRRDTVRNESAEKSVWRMANVVSITYQLRSGISIINALYLQPDISEFDDFRFLNELTMAIAIKKYVQVTISSVWRHDSKPPLHLEPNDISIETGIMIRFHRNN